MVSCSFYRRNLFWRSNRITDCKGMKGANNMEFCRMVKIDNKYYELKTQKFGKVTKIVKVRVKDTEKIKKFEAERS